MLQSIHSFARRDAPRRREPGRPLQERNRAQPSPAEISSCLDALVGSAELARSERLVRFLRFTVEQALAGRADEVKERTLGVEVYGRRPDYDLRTDPIVRTEAHRLRAKLRRYYAREGRSSPVVIEYEKGTYVPRFRQREPESSALAAPLGPEAQRLFSKGQHALIQWINTHNRLYLDQAERRLQAALELAPRHPEVLAELASLQWHQLYPPQQEPGKLLAGARALLEDALAEAPNHARSLSLLGEVCAVEGRHLEALALAERAVGLDPEDGQARSFLGLRYFQLGFYESAIGEYERAVALDPLWEIPYLVMARLLARLGRLGEAQAVVGRLREQIPSGPSVDYVSATLKIEEGALEAAERGLRRALRQHGSAADASHLEIALGLVAALRGDEAQGRRVLETYRDSPPRWSDHLFRLCLALREWETARKRLDKSPYLRHYRWLVLEPALDPLRSEPAWRALHEELWAAWQRHLAETAGRLPVPPPELPAPDALEAASRSAPKPRRTASR
jgi:tetratricopeptide (TPR) repeat protein